MSFDSTKHFILVVEGGAYHPHTGDYDPNETNLGVTQTTYDTYRHKKSLALRSVYEMDGFEWSDIFQSMFWGPIGGSQLPEPLDVVVADAAFNSGPKQALKFLQRAVGVMPDGLWGPATEKAVAGCDPRTTAIRVVGQRARFYRAIYNKWVASPPESRPLEPPPLQSWQNRLDSLQRFAKL